MDFDDNTLEFGDLGQVELALLLVIGVLLLSVSLESSTSHEVESMMNICLEKRY